MNGILSQYLIHYLKNNVQEIQLINSSTIKPDSNIKTSQFIWVELIWVEH